MDSSSRIRTRGASATVRRGTALKPATPAKTLGGAPALQRPLAMVIRRLRESRGLSQEAFADQIQMHRTYYGAIERGVRNVTLKSLEKVSAGLGEQLSKLIAEAEREASSHRSSREKA